MNGKIYRVYVVSTFMESVGYDQESQVMEIEFRDGSIRQYLQVPWETNRQFMIAADRDVFFDDFIDGKFEFREIGRE